MATAQELDLRTGDIVTGVSAYKITDERISGVHLTDPDATIEATIAEVLESPRGQSTTVRILASTNRTEAPGKVMYWHEDYRGYVGEGMERVHRELVRAGVIIHPTRGADRKITGVSVHRIQNVDTPPR